MKKLENKVAVITGGNSGIGLGIARKFREEGASVVIFGRNQVTLEASKQELDGDTLAIQGDVRNTNDLSVLFEEVKKVFGFLFTCLVAKIIRSFINCFERFRS